MRPVAEYEKQDNRKSNLSLIFPVPRQCEGSGLFLFFFAGFLSPKP